MAIKGTIYIKSDLKEPVELTPPVKKEIKKLDVLTSETESTIYTATSVFPFQLFPDKIIVDKNKVTIVRKQLLYKRIFPILIEDIRTVKVTRGPFFASIEFEVTGYEQNPSPTNYLWPEHAGRLEKYVMGLVKAKRDMVDITKLTISQIINRLEGIGGAEEEVENIF